MGQNDKKKVKWGNEIMHDTFYESLCFTDLKSSHKSTFLSIKNLSYPDTFIFMSSRFPGKEEKNVIEVDHAAGQELCVKCWANAPASTWLYKVYNQHFNPAFTAHCRGHPSKEDADATLINLPGHIKVVCSFWYC